MPCPGSFSTPTSVSDHQVHGNDVCFTQRGGKLLSPAWEHPPQVIASAFAVSSSLVMGKEGPMLHAGSILAVLLGKK